jgi:Spy/CpxP family protein refolding chaperone
MKNCKAIAGILLVFILGAAGGSLVTYMIDKARFEHFVSGGHRMREGVIVERLTKKLDLDGSQQEQVRGIMHETHEGIRQVRSRIHPQIEALLAAGQDRIKAVLRPDQREKFDRLIAEWKQRKPQQGEHGND